ncbi:family 16 glycosylhydrolase [Dactylosporangium sp. NPDC049140]|uniref:family 16 glycosylhydrolase n=1 Tax=Dactylosporangium sp. NPDC049140 TaxID=3155647 RepID=UPI0033C3C0BF
MTRRRRHPTLHRRHWIGDWKRFQIWRYLDNQSCPSGCSGKPYASGEYRSNDLFSYGRFETRLKAVKNPGTVTSFFTYTGPSDALTATYDWARYTSY